MNIWRVCGVRCLAVVLVLSRALPKSWRTVALATVVMAVGSGTVSACASIQPLSRPPAFTAPNAGEGIIPLPAPLHDGVTSVERALLQRRSVRDYEDASLSLAELGQLLWAAQGITQGSGLRTTPSAGALYPLEVYAVVGAVDGLAAGVYHYSPQEHGLTLVASGDRRAELRQAALGQAAVQDAPAVIVLAGVYERTAAKYGARAQRYVHMEVGAAAQNVALQAVPLGLGAVYIGAFGDDRISEVLRLRSDEKPLTLLPVGRPAR